MVTIGPSGRAGPALGIAAFGSFIAGTFGVVGLMAIAGPLARFALKFGPPEYVGLMVLGLIILTYLTEKSFMKSITMAVFGLILSYIGLDLISGQVRFTLNKDQLLEGIGMVPMVMGLSGSLRFWKYRSAVDRSIFKAHIKGLSRVLRIGLHRFGDYSWNGRRVFLGILPEEGNSGFFCFLCSRKESIQTP